MWVAVSKAGVTENSMEAGEPPKCMACGLLDDEEEGAVAIQYDPVDYEFLMK